MVIDISCFNFISVMCINLFGKFCLTELNLNGLISKWVHVMGSLLNEGGVDRKTILLIS